MYKDDENIVYMTDLRQIDGGNMLKIYDKLHDIDFRQLMDVYLQTNRESGHKLYPKLCDNLQMLYAEQDFYVFLSEFFTAESAEYYVWCDALRYVSALRLEAYQDGLLLEALETAPQDRGKGYAGALMHAVIDHLSTIGHGRIYSHIAKSNRLSLHLHKACGFCVYSEYATFIDGTEHADCYTMLYKW